MQTGITGPTWSCVHSGEKQPNAEQKGTTLGGHRRMEHPPAGSSRLVSNTHRTLVHIMTEN